VGYPSSQETAITSELRQTSESDTLALLNPVIAAAAVGISSVSVVSNSVRLFRFRA